MGADFTIKITFPGRSELVVNPFHFLICATVTPNSKAISKISSPGLTVCRTFFSTIFGFVEDRTGLVGSFGLPTLVRGSPKTVLLGLPNGFAGMVGIDFVVDGKLGFAGGALATV